MAEAILVVSGTTVIIQLLPHEHRSGGLADTTKGKLNAIDMQVLISYEFEIFNTAAQESQWWLSSHVQVCFECRDFSFPSNITPSLLTISLNLLNLYPLIFPNQIL